MGNDLRNVKVEDLISKLPGMLYRCKFDTDWTMEFITDGCKVLTGYLEDELIDNKLASYASIIHKDDIDWIFKVSSNAIKEKRTFNFEYRILTKDNQIKWVWEQGIAVYGTAGEVLCIEGFITDITNHKKDNDKLKEELNKKDKELLINHALLEEYKKAVDESAIVTKTDINGMITYVNKEFCRISGYSKEEVIGKSHNIVRHPQNPKALFENLWKDISEKKIWKGILKNRSKSHKTYYVQTVIFPILSYDGNIQEYIAIRHDVTDLILQEKKIKFQTTDAMTKLPNRQKLMEDLEEQNDLKLAILNIEKFREINEYYGFDIGDRLLVELSSTFTTYLKNYKAKLYKLPGDEFAILVDHETCKDDFKNMISSLLNMVKNMDFEIEKFKFSIRLISGVSMQKNYFINAEMATNHAKVTNKNLVFFEDNLNIKDQLIDNIKWTTKIKKAIEEDRIVVFAQPIVSNTTQNINKYECLVRMIDNDGTIISPFQFLNIAKRSRLYTSITKIVVEKSIEYFKDTDICFSINLTLDDILNANVIDFLIEKINNNPGIGKRLILEIVEDEGIENYSEVSSFIEVMKSFGCKIAIDDFGTGYSNFDYLMRLKVDFIKIDGSIIKNIDHDKNAKIVTELIVDFAKRLNIETIGEYVYKEEILEILKDMGVDYSQGFHLGKPEQLTEKAINNK
jgi:PAS domain S-box-containing protein/diguanylate cyclase (GGDEF)-like protein